MSDVADERSNGRTMRELMDEIRLMRTYMLEEGYDIRPELGAALVQLETRSRDDPEVFANADPSFAMVAFAAYDELARAIKPVTPRTLGFARRQTGRARWLKFPKWLFYVAVAALVALVASQALAPMQTTPQPTTQDRIGLQFGWLAAALLGASFYVIIRAYHYFVRNTYDPQFNIVYMTRLVLGTVAGYILAHFGGGLFGGAAGDITSGATDGATTPTLSPLVFAVLGGFTGEAVGVLLERVAATLTFFVKGREEPESARERITQAPEAAASSEVKALAARQQTGRAPQNPMDEEGVHLHIDVDTTTRGQNGQQSDGGSRPPTGA